MTVETVSASLENRPRRVVDVDGATLDIFDLPTDEETLKSLFRDLFENHWSEIVFGPIIQGAAFEFHPPSPPTYIGTMDGYLTIAFGASHFHLCIGLHKGAAPALAQHRQTARAELYRRLDRKGAPISWGLRLFNGHGEQQITVLLPNPFLDPETDSSGNAGSVSASRIRSIDPAIASAMTRVEMLPTSTRSALMQTQSFAQCTGWRRPIWIALLVAASVAFTLGFDCGTPLAAFAAIAALSMRRKDALLMIGLVWLANQAVGFSVLHYPLTSECFAWGVGLGIVALLATLGAEWAAERFNPLGRLASAMAFLATFAIYEGLLFLASIIVQSGVEDYAAAIVGRIFAINAVAFIGLLAVNRIGVSAGLALEPRRQLIATGRRG